MSRVSSASAAILRRSLLTSASRSFTTASASSVSSTPAISKRFATTHQNLIRPVPFKRSFHQSTARMGGVHNLQSKAEFEAAKAEKGVLQVVDCFATWCGPCKVIAPKVVSLSETYETAKFYKVDVDEVPDVAQELNIRAMPTFVLLLDGEVVKEVVGANPKALEAAISDAVENLKNDKKE